MAQTYTKDKIDQLLETAGTTVVANPDPAGTTALTGIQIGDTKYAVGGGDKIYRHTFDFRIGPSSSSTIAYGRAEYYSTKSTAYTSSTLEVELNARGANNTATQKGIPVELWTPPSSNTVTSIYQSGQLWGGGVLRCSYIYFSLQDNGFRSESSFSTVQSFTDYVSEL